MASLFKDGFGFGLEVLLVVIVIGLAGLAVRHTTNNINIPQKSKH